MRVPSAQANGGTGMYPWIDRGASPTSSWYRTSSVGTGANIATYTCVADTIYASYFSVPVICTLTELGVHVVNGVALSSARLGVYRTGGWGSPYPTTLLLDAGTVPTTVGAGPQFVTGLTLRLQQDVLYASVFLTQSTPGFSCGSSLTTWNTWGSDNTLAMGRSCVYHAQAWGALPTTFPSAAPTAVNAGTGPSPTMYTRYG